MAWWKRADGAQLVKDYRVRALSEPVRVMSHLTTPSFPKKEGCTATHNSYYHEISWCSSNYSIAIMIGYLYLWGTLVVRPLRVVRVGTAGAALPTCT